MPYRRSYRKRALPRRRRLQTTSAFYGGASSSGAMISAPAPRRNFAPAISTGTQTDGRRTGWGSGTRTVRRRKQDQSNGDYNQISVARLQTGKKKKVTLALVNKQLHQKEELTIYRWNGIKSFDDNGYYWCGRVYDSVAAQHTLPVYVYDLTGVVNTTSGGVLGHNCMKRLSLKQSNGFMSFVDQNHLLSDGTTTSTTIQVESAPTSATAVNYPHQKSVLKWTDVKMNLWGAKNRATKYVIQVIKIFDEGVDPWFARTAGTTDDDKQYQGFWQAICQPYCFNPIAHTNPLYKRKFKVLKTYSTIIQPTSTSENDADPHVKTLHWFMRWDRSINYAQGGDYLRNATDVVNEAGYIQEEAKYGTTTTDTKQKIFLLIRAQACFQQTTTETNADAPSFDLFVRAAHVPQ